MEWNTMDQKDKLKAGKTYLTYPLYRTLIYDNTDGELMSEKFIQYDHFTGKYKKASPYPTHFMELPSPPVNAV